MKFKIWRVVWLFPNQQKHRSPLQGIALCKGHKLNGVAHPALPRAISVEISQDLTSLRIYRYNRLRRTRSKSGRKSGPISAQELTAPRATLYPLVATNWTRKRRRYMLSISCFFCSYLAGLRMTPSERSIDSSPCTRYELASLHLQDSKLYIW